MKNLYTKLLLFSLFIFFGYDNYAQSVSATYSAGDIPTRRYHYVADCNGPTYPLNVTLPAGGPWRVTSIDIAYDMTAVDHSGPGEGWKSEQRSLIHFQNKGINENNGTPYSGSGDAIGTQVYSRTGVTIANGVYNGNEVLTFEMRAHRTYDGSTDCGTDVNKVDNNSWTITVYYTADNTSTTVQSQTTPSCVGDADASASLVSTNGSSQYSYIWPSSVASNISAVNRLASTTGNTIVATGNNRLLVIAIATREENGSSSNPATLINSSVTYGGQTLTYLTEINTHGGNRNLMLELFYLDEAGISAASNSTIAAYNDNFTAAYVHSAMFENVDQDNPFGLIQSNYELNTNDATLSLNGRSLNTSEYNYIIVANAEKKTTTANSGALTGFTEFTDETGTSAQGYDLGLSTHGFQATSNTNIATGDITISANCESKVATSLVINPEASSISGLSAGVYAVTTTSFDVITDITNVTIIDPTPIAITLTANDFNGFEVSCNSSSDGQITASASGGTVAGDYVYNWQTGSTSNVISSLPASAYSITVTDDNGCNYSSSITLTEPTVLNAAPSVSVVAAYNGEDVSCNGANDGILQANASGGVTPYSYLWNPAAYSSSSATVANLPAGTGYTVTVTDNNGCSASNSVNITEPSAITVSSTINSTITCNGNNDGQITAIPSGGTGSFTYSWSTNAGAQSATSGIATALNAGTYYVTTTDDNGCNSPSSAFTISEPNSINISTAGASDISCNGGSNGAINISVSGGQAPYTFIWSNTATTEDISGLAAGTFNLTVEDVNTCTDTYSYTITEPTALVAALVTTVAETCFGDADGSLDINVSGGTTPYSYLWSNTAITQDISSLVKGNYTVTVTDALSCIDNLTVTIEGSNALLTLGTSVTTPASCFSYSDGALDISVTDGTAPYDYSWSNSATTQDITGLFAGTFTVSVIDSYNCLKTLTQTITEPSGMTFNTTITDISACSGTDGAINLSVTGGVSTNYTYTWSNAATTQNITGLIGGSYAVTVNDGSCNQTNSSLVSSGGSLAITVTGTDVTCFSGTNGTASVSITAGNTASTYLWNNTATTNSITGLSAGTYTVTVTDANCNEISSVVIAQPSSAVAANITGNNSVSCNSGNNGSLTVTASGGNGAPYTYLWDDAGSQTYNSATGLIAGNYSVTVTDVSGICSANTTVSLAEPNAINITGATTSVTCNGSSNGTINITVTGGTVSGNYTYSWVGNGVNATSKNQSDVAAGVHNLTVTDDNSCTNTETFTVTQASSLTITTTVTSNYNGADITCFGLSNGKARVDVTGGNSNYTYLWDNAEVTQEAVALNAGIHSVTVKDNGICDQVVNVTITEPSVLAGNIAKNAINGNDISCIGSSDGSATLAPTGGTAGFTYNWNTTPAQTSITATGLYVGPTYRVTITDANGCKDIETTTLANPPILTLTTAVTSFYNGEDISCVGSSDGQATATLTGGSGNTTDFTYVWNTTPQQNTATATGLTNASYIVTASDANGCSKTKNIILSAPSSLAVAAAISTTYNGAEVSCNGASDGAVSTSIILPGTGTNYTYAWSSTSQTNANVTGLASGTHTVTVTDINGCTATDDIVLSDPSTITLTTSVVSSYGALNTETSCSYSSDGAANVVASGGTGAYTYLWDNTDNTSTTNSTLSSGNHSVTVYDANNCPSIGNVTITPASAIVANESQTNVAVAGSSTGQASVAPSGGQNPYTYEWTQVSGVITPANYQNSAITNMPANTYNMTITDANSCELAVVFVITENATLGGGSITHADANGAILNVCINDTAITNITQTAGASGGNGVYFYEWEFSTDFVNWSTIVPNVTTTDYTNTFYASETKVVRRKTTDGVGATAYSNSMIMLSVDTTTTLSFMPSSYCTNDDNDQNLLVSPSNVSATWVFNDLTNVVNTTLTTQGDGRGSFVPLDFNSLSGDHSITHIYTNNNGCVSTLVTTVTLNPKTSISLTAPTLFNIGSDVPLVLDNTVGSHVGSPVSNVFSGSFVSYNGSDYEYNPTTPGNHTIQYVHIDINGCSDTATHDISATNSLATIQVNGSDQQIGNHLCMADIDFNIVCQPGGNNIYYTQPDAVVITYIDQNNIQQTAYTTSSSSFTLNESQFIPGGDTYTITYKYVTSNDGITPLDTLIAVKNFDITDNYHIDFYVGETIENSDFEFCFEYDSTNYRAHYTYGNKNLIGLGTYSSSTTLENLGSSNDDGRAWYNPAVETTADKDTIRFNHTMIPSGCIMDTAHVVTVFGLPNLSLSRIVSADSLYCRYDVDTIIPNIVNGDFQSSSAAYLTQFDTAVAAANYDKYLWIFDVQDGTYIASGATNVANVTATPNYTNSLCNDGYTRTPMGTTSALASGLFNMAEPAGTYTNVKLALYYTDCNSNASASFDIYLNGNYVTSFTSLGQSCSCTPNTSGGAASYPHIVNLNGVLFDPYWNVHPSDLLNSITVNVNGGTVSDVYISGVTAHLSGSTGGLNETKGYFTAANASNGVNTITYEYTDNNGCYNSVDMDLVVLPRPIVYFEMDTLFNIIESPYNLYADIANMDLLSSWSFTGGGVTNSNVSTIDMPTNFGNLDTLIGEYTPSFYGLGNDMVYFNYTDTNNCSFQLSDATVIQQTQVTIDIDSLYCTDSPLVTITASAANSDGDFGTFSASSGTGLDDYFDDTAELDPSGFAIGPVTITYSYFGFDGTTEFSLDTAIEIRDKPIVVFDMDTLFNIIEAPVVLTATPSTGGVFTGTGITTGNTFDPSVAGLGEFEITFTYTDAQGCSNFIIDSTVVQEASGYFENLPFNELWCEDAGKDSIWVIADNIHPDSTGTFTEFNGFVDLNNDTAYFTADSITIVDDINYVVLSYTYPGFDGTTYFTLDTTIKVAKLPVVNFTTMDTLYNVVQIEDLLNMGTPVGGIYSSNNAVIDGDTIYPAATGIGNYGVTYTYTDGNGCVNSMTDSTVIQEAQGTFYGVPLDNNFCIDETSVVIGVVPDNSDGTKWEFGGIPTSSIVGNIDSVTINPNALGLNSHTLTFTYFGFDGTTEFTIDTTFDVVDLPVLDFSIDTLQNYVDPAIVLSATPSGGTFSGAGVSGNNFTPMNAGIGTHIINYSYTDANSCTNSTTDQVLVDSARVVFVGVNNYYCIDGIDDNVSVIVGNYLGLSQPIKDGNGRFDGLTVIDQNNDTAIYQPNQNAFGDNTNTIQYIAYEYDGFDGNTIFRDTAWFTVTNVGTISILGYNNEYCIDEPIDTIYALPTYATGSGAFTSITGGNISLGDTLLFNPSLAGDSDPANYNDGNHYITYKFTDFASGCYIEDTDTVKVHALPELEIVSETIGSKLSAGKYCMSEDTAYMQVEINGDLYSNTINPGLYWGNGVSNEGDGSAIFNPSSIGVLGQHDTVDYVYYEFTDPISSCYNSTSTSVTVYSLPVLQIFNINAAKQYCGDDAGVTLSFLDTMGVGPFNTSSWNWTINGVIKGVNGDLVPNKNLHGKWPVVIEYTDAHECYNWTSDTVTISPMPIAGWYVYDQCIADSMEFIDTSYVDNTLGDVITEWKWDFGVSNGIDSVQFPKFLYNDISTKDVELEVITNNGCSDIKVVQLKNLGSTPPVDFSWASECDDDIQFNIPATVRNYGSGTDWSLDFGDGTIINGTFEDSVAYHNFASNTTYEVTMIVGSDASGCSDTASKFVHVRDVYTPSLTSPYYTDFENGKDGWLNELKVEVDLSDQVHIQYDTLASSWEFGTPNKTIINAANSGANAWITGLNSSYVANQRAEVVSPCFDLSLLERPMIKLWINSTTNIGADGTALQYTTDKGETWHILGNIGTGINWFNASNIFGKPGDQSQAENNTGWTGSSTNSSWIEARHNLDSLLGENDVRFRIAFGSIAQGNEGFAFDDIWIGERSRVALLEHFTNQEDAASLTSNDNVNNIVAEHEKDVLDIQYHTNFPLKDEMNNFNPGPPSARSLYYGLNHAPYSIMDGNVYRGENWNESDLSLRVLEDPQFDIKLVSTIDAGNNITIDVEATSKLNLGNADISVHIAVLEKDLTYNSTVFNSVLREMLPDGGGTNFDEWWYSGKKVNITESYSLKNLTDPTNFKVVAFVQDNKTQEVYQAAYNDNAYMSTTIDDFEETVINNDYIVYPNPSKGIFNIEFYNSDTHRVSIYNQYGQIVADFVTNETNNSLTLSELSTGIYHLVVQTGNNISTDKIMINK